MSLKPDKILLSSSMPSFIQIATYSNTFTVSGSLAAGANITYTCSIPITRSNSRYDVYIQNNASAGRIKQILSNSNYLVAYYSHGEVWGNTLTYSSTSITFTLTITNNTASPITLTTQPYILSAVEYRTPF